MLRLARDRSDNDDAEEGVDYQFEMMRCLREVNVDSNTGVQKIVCGLWF